MSAESEEEVVKILKRENLWDDTSQWAYYGGMENNWGIIGSQQAKPESALVEKIVNSVDAVLMRECYLRNIDPASASAPRSISDAVQLFFNVKNGNLSKLSASKRVELSREIGLIATGQKSEPNYIIFDRGEGQEPQKFPNTFLSLNKSNKLRIPFVQGTFNMGGTGVIRFCGVYHIQVLLSRRHPSFSEDTNWGFTVIRRQEPTQGVKHSVYTYLAPNGNIPEFPASQFEIPLPRKGTEDIEPLKYGTIIKLFNYRMPGGLKTNILFDLFNKLSVLLPRIGLPIRLYERRDYVGHSQEATLAGLQVRLDEDRKNLDSNFPPSSNVFYINEQKYSYSIYVFNKGGSEKYRKNEGVIFTFNGQAHGFLSTTFFERNTINFDYIADSLLVLVDCSEIDQATREDLFMNSRDRLTEGELRNTIEQELEKIISGHQGLKRLNYLRREEAIKQKTGESKPLQEVLESIIYKSPSLKALFTQGGDFSNPYDMTTGNVDEEFKGKNFPTYFRLMKGEERKVCYIGQRFRVQYETDVVDNYFFREEHKGDFKLFINGKEYKNYRLNSWKGVYTLNVLLPDGVSEGDILECKSLVTDDTQIEPFTSEFLREVKGPIKEHQGGKGGRKKPSKEGEGERQKPGGLALPVVKEVYKNGWDEHQFDEFSALKVSSVGEEGGYDYYINMDNKYIQHEIKKRNLENESELIFAKYKYSMVLIGMAILKDQDIFQKEMTHENGGFDIKWLIRQVTRAFAPISIPMIEILGELNMEDIKRDYTR
jgi:hypothetical protein